MRLDVVAAGCAGQGVTSLSHVLARAAMAEGFEVSYMAHSGVSQLEGPVMAHVRIGTPAGPSPKVRLKGADAVVALDHLEALRASPWLKPGGIALVDDEGYQPVAARGDEGAYPTIASVREALDDAELHFIPATKVAREMGSAALAGSVMLGALNALRPTVERDDLVRTLRESFPKLADENVEAFFTGYKLISGQDH